MEDTNYLLKLDLLPAHVVERDSRVTAILKKPSGETIRAHLRNTGRLKDLVYPAAKVYYEEKRDGKTDGRLISVEVQNGLVLLDTLIQTRSFEKAVEKGLIPWIDKMGILQKEVPVEEGRIDYLISANGRKELLEVKSAVAEKDEWGLYPDAPTQRGLKHVKLLKDRAKKGNRPHILFILTHPDQDKFRPYVEVQPEIGDQLAEAKSEGVSMHAMKMGLTRRGEVFLDKKYFPVSIAS